MPCLKHKGYVKEGEKRKRKHSTGEATTQTSLVGETRNCNQLGTSQTTEKGLLILKLQTEEFLPATFH